MSSLTSLTTYQEAQENFSKKALWELFDGDRTSLNIAHECLDRHANSDINITIMREIGEETHLIAEVTSWANRFAHFLASKGLKKGDRVAIMLEPSLAFYFSLFGAMKFGAVAVPLYTLFGRDGLALRVNDCKPTLLVTDHSKADIAYGFDSVEVVLVDEDFNQTLSSFKDVFEADTSSNDMAMYQYTSGTTRELPEAVKHRHRAVVTVMVAALYGTGIRPGDRFCCPSSPAWGHGLWHGTIAPLALGVSIYAWAGRFNAGRLLQGLSEHRITNLSAAATHYRLMKNSGKSTQYDYYIEKLTYTGEPTDSTTEQFIIDTFGQRACSMYGTTEVGVILVNYPGASDIDVKPRSLGKAVPGIKVDIHNTKGESAAPNEIGEIVVWRGNGWVHTKDLGHRDEEGYFFHGGRADDVIISAGWTMSAKEIEDTLLKHSAVAEAAAIGVPDPIRGQVVKAYIVSRQSPSDTLAEEIQMFTRERLSAHEFPREVEFVKQLPKTPSGKVNRQALRKSYAAKSS